MHSAFTLDFADLSLRVVDTSIEHRNGSLIITTNHLDQYPSPHTGSLVRGERYGSISTHHTTATAYGRCCIRTRT